MSTFLADDLALVWVVQGKGNVSWSSYISEVLLISGNKSNKTDYRSTLLRVLMLFYDLPLLFVWAHWILSDQTDVLQMFYDLMQTGCATFHCFISDSVIFYNQAST